MQAAKRGKPPQASTLSGILRQAGPIGGPAVGIAVLDGHHVTASADLRLLCACV